MSQFRVHPTNDTIILGSGLAGMAAALQIKDRGIEPILITKGKSEKNGATAIARAGFSVVQNGSEDSLRSHIEDTLSSGRGLCDPDLVSTYVHQSIRYVPELEKHGVTFDRGKDGRLKTYLGGGHTHPRMIYTIHKNGPDISIPLIQKIRNQNIEIHKGLFVFDVLKKNALFYVICLNQEKGTFQVFVARTVIVATGGAGQIYQVTRTPLEATGDGFALAFNLGAELVDMEFVQHYPLEVAWPRSETLHADIPASLPSLGAKTKNALGEPFMNKHDSRGDLATRDIHARGMFQEILAGRGVRNGVWLDLSGVKAQAVKETMPDYYAYFLEQRIPRKEWKVIVSPGAHYFMGGIVIDTQAQTSIPGLFACGEVTGGVHGANRLACNSLPDCVVFGTIAGQSVVEFIMKNPPGNEEPFCPEVEAYIQNLDRHIGEDNHVEQLQSTLKQRMWVDGGLIRTGEGLTRLVQYIDRSLGGFSKWAANSREELSRLFELRNMYITAKLVSMSAQKRKESRGSHFRKDYPETNEQYIGNFIIKQSNGEPQLMFRKR